MRINVGRKWFVNGSTVNGKFVIMKREWYDKDRDRDQDLRDKDRDHYQYILPHNRFKGKESSSFDLEKFKSEDVLDHILMGVKESDWILREMKSVFSKLNQILTYYSPCIKKLKTQLGQILAHLNTI